MITYISRPVEVEAIRWSGSIGYAASADRIVAWVNDHGGEARYEPESKDSFSPLADMPARIAVRTINGWAYAAPGHYIVMGTARFLAYDANPDWPGRTVSTRELRDFYPCDPETFEKRWEPKP